MPQLTKLSVPIPQEKMARPLQPQCKRMGDSSVISAPTGTEYVAKTQRLSRTWPMMAWAMRGWDLGFSGVSGGRKNGD